MFGKKQTSTLFLLLLALGLISGILKIATAQNNSPPTPPRSTPEIIVQQGEVRALPGKLDTVPMFNSNSPEWLKTEGILLSTFPPSGKAVPQAHLNFPFSGRFDLFAHHQTINPKDLQTFYLGIILHNPSNKSVTVDVLQAASYLTQDSPYIKLPNYVENPENTVYSGAGDRASHDILQNKRQPEFPSRLIIPPGQYRMLLNHPIPVKNADRNLNGRSTLMRLQSNGKVYAASLAAFAKTNSDGTEPTPTLEEWISLLNTGSLALPRDKTPSPPQQIGGQLIYGRVAGVAQGSVWKAVLSDANNTNNLTIPQPGKAISYAINTLRGGRLGTNQIQTAPMLVRYPDTAYEAQGNYAVEYNISLPLYNPTNQAQTVTLTLETPLKEDKLSQGGLRFRKPSLDFPFFRGTVRSRYNNEKGELTTRYVHLWHRTGEVLAPLETLAILPQTSRSVQFDFIYPPDSTPPHVLTIRTLTANSN
jgi:Protein of unknown function (DUF3370)